MGNNNFEGENNVNTIASRGGYFIEQESQNSIISDQISRLQQRQIEMVEQTTRELEALKTQLKNNREVAELRRHIVNLELENERLASNLQNREKQYVAQIRQIQESLTTILDQTIQTSPEEYKPLEYKPIAFEEPVVIEEKKKPNKIKIKPARKERKSYPKLKAGLSFATVATIGFAGWATISPIIARNNASVVQGQVEGVSTDKNVTNGSNSSNTTINSYAESFAKVSFNETTWETISDKDFGVSISYPKNATNVARTIGGNNIWFLRKEGYLMKITRYSNPDKTIEMWWSDNQNDYTQDYKIEKTTYKGQVAYHTTPKYPDTVSGESYFIKKGDHIIQIWTKSQPEDQDDVQRLNQMIESLRIS